MADESTIGAGPRAFPSTQWSRVARLRDRDRPGYRAALDELCRIYWKPVYAHFRRSRPMADDEARDLTQDFFVELMEGDLLARAEPDRGSFRSYLKGAVRLFLLERHRSGLAAKRGGDRRTVPLEEAELARLDRALTSSAASPEEAFEREWTDSLIGQALADLRREMEAAGQAALFKAFERHQLAPATERPTHAALAQDLGMTDAELNHALAATRQSLRARIVDRIRAYVGDEREVAEELHRIFSIREAK